MTGQSVGSDASPLSCFLFRLRKSRKSARNAVIPRLSAHQATPPEQTAHVRFKGMQRVHTPPVPLTAHTAAHTPKQGCFRYWWYHYPRAVLRGSETLRGRVSEWQTLPLLGLGRVCSQRTQKAFGTATRSCASLSRGVAAPLGCVIPLLFLLPHRWASRFCSAASLAHRKLSACSLVTAVRFLNRCSRRSM